MNIYKLLDEWNTIRNQWIEIIENKESWSIPRGYPNWECANKIRMNFIELDDRLKQIELNLLKSGYNLEDLYGQGSTERWKGWPKFLKEKV